MEGVNTAFANLRDDDPYDAGNIQKNMDRYKVLTDVYKARARRKHLNFIDYLWANPSEPFIIGLHTRLICKKIDEALDRYARGQSTFLVMAVPFRHGKAFQIDTPILTVTGWKRHGDICPGDYVFNAEGEAVEVRAVTEVYSSDEWQVLFAHNEIFYTAGAHEWVISYYNADGVKHIEDRVLETKQIKFRGRKGVLRPFIHRYKQSNELAEHNNGNCIYADRVEIIKITASRKKHRVNCIQVDGGIYLIGKSLIPTHNSEILSRKLPAHFLGLFPDGKVLMTGHTAALSVGYSKESRNLISSYRYGELFPETKVNPHDSSAAHWRLEGREGEVFATGLGGSMAGQGYGLGIVDDYCRNREAAESPTQRQKGWHSFTNDFLTRRAPRSITIVTATRWHIDDIIGRIETAMEVDPFFPKFEIIVMPAFSDRYEYGILFPERFNREWYDEQRASLGEYGTASLLQCNPTAQGGNILKIDNVQKMPLEDFPDISYARIWDLAHSEKQRTGHDPDYTSGTLLGMRKKPGAARQWQLFIKDVKRFRLDAPKRDNQILNITMADGAFVKVGIENTVDSKDAFLHLQNILLGQRIVIGIKTKGDKVVRASALEPIFESGDVFVPNNAAWTNAWIEELGAFPAGKHDDQVDNLSAGYAMFNQSAGAVTVNMYGV